MSLRAGENPRSLRSSQSTERSTVIILALAQRIRQQGPASSLRQPQWKLSDFSLLSRQERSADQFGTPVFVYDERTLKKNAENCLRFPNAYGLTVRYAMKASSNAAILKTFEDLGLYIDASSGFEVERALRAEIAPEKISLSSQEIPRNLGELCEKGISFNASSLNQISRFGRTASGRRARYPA